MDLMKSSYYIEDVDGDLSLDEVLSLRKEWKNFERNSHLFSKTNRKYWIISEFFNDSEENEVFLGGWFQNKLVGSDLVFYVYIDDVFDKRYNNEDSKKDFERKKSQKLDKGHFIKIRPKSNVRVVIELPTQGHNIKTNLYAVDIYTHLKFSYDSSSYYTLTVLFSVLSFIFLFIVGFYTKYVYFLYFGIYSFINLLLLWLWTNPNIFPSFFYFLILWYSLKTLQVYSFFKFALEFLRRRFYIKARKIDSFFRNSFILITFFNLLTLLKLVTGNSIFYYFHYLSFFVFLAVTQLFFMILFKIRYRYATLFFVVHMFGILSSISRFVMEQILGIFTVGLSPHFFGSYDIASDVLIVFALILDRMHVARVESAIDKNSERFVFALGTSERKDEIFSKALLSLKSYIYYDRAYFILNDIGMVLLTSIPSLQDKEEDIFNFIIANKEEIEKNYFSMFNKSGMSKFFKNANSSLIIPISIQDNMLGYVILISKENEFYEGIELDLVKDFASKAAFVIEHFKNVQALNEKEKAIEIYQNMGLFHKNSVHEIKIPLFSLSDSLTQLKNIYGSYYKNEREDIVQYLDSIEESLESSMDQIEESLSMVGEEESVVFDVSYIKDNMSSLRKLCHFLDIRLEEDYLLPLDTELFGPKKSIKNVVNMIFKNAIEALEKTKLNRKKIIKMDFIIEDGKLLITIIDNGYGMSEEAKRNLFKLYTEGKMLSSGQGLMICKAIINKLGGDININSSPNLFTKVSFSFDIVYKG
tara:strand:- start:5129 stop:7396 length:2268 start_codon:yes stop_codon:yes gene_type:complete